MGDDDGRVLPLWEQVDREGSAFEVGAYLARLGFDETPPLASKETLDLLLRAHLNAVPFENLDVFGRESSVPSITLEFAKTYDKIVRRQRGGFCFEVNVAFGWLLRRLGFDAKYALGRVWRGTDVKSDAPNSFVENILEQQSDAWDGTHSPTHIMVVVKVDGNFYLCDVGFGDVPLIPLPLATSKIIDIPGDYSYLFKKKESLMGLYRISKGFPGLCGVRSEPGTPEPRILFDLNLHRPAAHSYPGLFRCQVDDEEEPIKSPLFRKMLLMTRYDLDGTKHVLMNARLRVTTPQAQVQETILENEDDFAKVLKTNFRIETIEEGFKPAIQKALLPQDTTPAPPPPEEKKAGAEDPPFVLRFWPSFGEE